MSTRVFHWREAELLSLRKVQLPLTSFSWLLVCTAPFLSLSRPLLTWRHSLTLRLLCFLVSNIHSSRPSSSLLLLCLCLGRWRAALIPGQHPARPLRDGRTRESLGRDGRKYLKNGLMLHEHIHMNKKARSSEPLEAWTRVCDPRASNTDPALELPTQQGRK